MIYDVHSFDGFLGTFETDMNIYKLYDVLCKVFERVSLTFIPQASTDGFINKFYVYKHIDSTGRNVNCLGSFMTNLSMLEVFDYVSQVFNAESDTGIFLRKEILL